MHILRVSEIITGYGRLIHKQIEMMDVECYAFQTVFGFTNSIFIRHSTTSSTAPDNIITTDFSNQYIAKLLQDYPASIKYKD